MKKRVGIIFIGILVLILVWMIPFYVRTIKAYVAEKQSSVVYSDFNNTNGNVDKNLMLTMALENTLSAMLEDHDDIDAAAVQINRGGEKNTVSVTVTTNGPLTEENIDRLVLQIKKSLEKIEDDDIEIMDQDGNILYPY